MRKQHDQIDLVAVAERFDRGAAGIARGRNGDGAPLATRREHVIHQPRQELHRQIFESERRPVMQLEHEGIDVELDQRRDRGMAECAVSIPHHAGELGLD